MSKHTPGPWLIAEDQVGDDDGNTIATICQLNIWNTTEGMVTEEMPWEANARLIAAAPELFDVLRELSEALLIQSVPLDTALQKAITLFEKLTDE